MQNVRRKTTNIKDEPLSPISLGEIEELQKENFILYIFFIIYRYYLSIHI